MNVCIFFLLNGENDGFFHKRKNEVEKNDQSLYYCTGMCVTLHETIIAPESFFDFACKELCIYTLSKTYDKERKEKERKVIKKKKKKTLLK